LGRKEDQHPSNGNKKGSLRQILIDFQKIRNNSPGDGIKF